MFSALSWGSPFSDPKNVANQLFLKMTYTLCNPLKNMEYLHGRCHFEGEYDPGIWCSDSIALLIFTRLLPAKSESYPIIFSRMFRPQLAGDQISFDCMIVLLKGFTGSDGDRNRQDAMFLGCASRSMAADTCWELRLNFPSFLLPECHLNILLADYTSISWDQRISDVGCIANCLLTCACSGKS